MSEQEKYNRLIEAIKSKAAEILPKGSRVALYGSRARDDARPDSDWDIHILVPGNEKLPLDLWDEYAWPMEQIGLDFGEFVTPAFIPLPDGSNAASCPSTKTSRPTKL